MQSEPQPPRAQPVRRAQALGSKVHPWGVDQIMHSMRTSICLGLGLPDTATAIHLPYSALASQPLSRWHMQICCAWECPGYASFLAHTPLCLHMPQLQASRLPHSRLSYRPTRPANHSHPSIPSCGLSHASSPKRLHKPGWPILMPSLPSFVCRPSGGSSRSGDTSCPTPPQGQPLLPTRLWR